MILDLHRHLQRHRLWHKTPQRIATRLIAYGDLDHRLMFILGEGQGQGTASSPRIVKILIQSSEPMQRGRRERWRADDQSAAGVTATVSGTDLGDRLTVDVQSSLNVDVERQPQALESPVRGRVEAGGDLDALGLGGYWDAVYGTGQAKACSRSATPVSRSR